METEKGGRRERVRGKTAAHSVSITGPEEKHETINSFIPDVLPQQILIIKKKI